MDWAVFFKEYPAVVTAATGLLGIILGAVLTRWSDNRKKSRLQNRERDKRAAAREMKIREARDLVNAFDSIIRHLISHVEELVTVIRDGDADQITREFHKMNEFRLKMKSLLAESKRKLADIALLNDRQLLEMFLTLADSARTVSDEAQAIPGEYAYGDSAFADTRLKKLQDILAEILLAVKSIKGRIEELAVQIE
jgi:hypothetical protein